MKKIYIVLTYTGTVLSKIIKYYTHCEFSHVSISLDQSLKSMYSFGRLNPYNPFHGGFVHEEIGKGTFRRFKDTRAIIYYLNVTDEQYKKIKNTISLINREKEKYKFNLIGLFAVSMHLRIKRKKCFYCAEFVKYLLDQSQMATNLPDIIKPEDFRKIQDIKPIYIGKLNQYSYQKPTRLRYNKSYYGWLFDIIIV